MNIHVAFFRNLNLGRPNCPTKVQFEEAFGAAAAVSASSFLTNGTLVFTTGASSESKRVFNGACEILRSTCLSSCNEQLQRAVATSSRIVVGLMLMLPRAMDAGSGSEQARPRGAMGSAFSSVKLGTFDLSFAHVRTYARSSQPGDRSSRA